jgi:hypothetical protein
VKLGLLDISNQNLRFPADKETNVVSAYITASAGFQTMRKLRKRILYTYSPKPGAAFCFCFNSFNSNSDSLTSCGFRDWQGLSKVLKTHEVCRNHVTNICSRKELANRIRSSCLIDEANQDRIQNEVESWRLVLERVFTIIMFLVERYLVAGNDRANPANGNILDRVLLMSKYDPRMADRVRRVSKPGQFVSK